MLINFVDYAHNEKHDGEGNGNPLQCSCLENPRDGGDWWAAVCGVTRSQKRLKRLSDLAETNTTLYSNYTLIKVNLKNKNN